MKDNIVSVRLWGQEICLLEWKGGYKKGFGKIGSKLSFNRNYNALGFDVDPIGPYRKSVYLVSAGLSDILRATENEGLPRFLSGSLPDDWGNKVFASWVQSSNIRSSDITSVDKLSFIGSRGMGGFEFVPQQYQPETDDAVDLEELYHLAKEIEAAREAAELNLQDRPGVKDLMAVGMSAGGKHPKAIVAINWETGEVRSGQVALPEGFTYYILKFRDSESWPTAEIEYTYHKIALDCGIDMEESRLLPAGGVNHFLTKRFDRNGGEKRHAATLYALNGETAAYEDIFRVCRKLRLPYHDIEQVYRRMVFNYLACVCDDHDKNFSFTMSREGKWRLSPAYDETFTVNLVNMFRADRHAMTVGGIDREVSRDTLLRVAQENDVKNAASIIRQVADAVMSFEALANENHIGKPVSGLVMKYISNQMGALE